MLEYLLGNSSFALLSSRQTINLLVKYYVDVFITYIHSYKPYRTHTAPPTPGEVLHTSTHLSLGSNSEIVQFIAVTCKEYATHSSCPSSCWVYMYYEVYVTHYFQYGLNCFTDETMSSKGDGQEMRSIGIEERRKFILVG